MTGTIAARTNNAVTGVAAIAYNCPVKNYAKLSDSTELAMSRDGLKIINLQLGLLNRLPARQRPCAGQSACAAKHLQHIRWLQGTGRAERRGGPKNPIT